MNTVHTLLIEDEPVQAAMFGSYLRSSAAHRFIVREAGDLKSALLALRSGPCDLILLDLILPNGAGVQVIDRVRGAMSGLGIDVPLVVITALNEADIEYEALRRRATEFAYKRDLKGAEDLLHIIEKAFARHNCNGMLESQRELVQTFNEGRVVTEQLIAATSTDVVTRPKDSDLHDVTDTEIDG